MAANHSYPSEDLTLDNIRYNQLAEPETECSENYYPDWSRIAFMDIRNVRGLVLN